MTEKTPKPTHKISFYGVRCYYSDITGELWGCNRVWDWLVPVATGFHNYFVAPFQAEPTGFPFRVIEEY